MRKYLQQLTMQRIPLAPALLATVFLAGCPEKPRPVANSPETKSPPPATATEPPLAVSPPDAPDAIAQLEAKGVKLTRDKSGVVTTLEVQSADLKDPDLQLLKGLPSLVDIDLKKSSITNDGLAILQSFPNLKALGLQRCNLLTNDGLKHLEHVPNLERLYILYTLISNDGMEHIARLKKLKLLDLRGAKVGNEGIAKLEGHPTLVDLKLRAESIDNDALPAIASIKQLRSLEAEDASLFGDIGALAVLTDLQKLNLMRTYVDAQSFVPLKNLTKLRDVRLRGTATRATVLDSLLASKDTLTYLDLTECPIVDAELAPIEQFQKLETLEIWQTDLSDAGLPHIGKLINLKSLDISKCLGVTAAGVVELLPLTKLQTLNLSETGVDDAALEKLAALTQLKSLDLRLTSVTDDGVAKFKAAVPDCNVVK